MAVSVSREKRVSLAAVLLLVAVFGVVANWFSQQPRTIREFIAGKWKYQDEDWLHYEQVYEFKPNGTFRRTEHFTRGARVVTGTYEVNKGRVLTISLRNAGPDDGPMRLIGPQNTVFRVRCAVDPNGDLLMVKLTPSEISDDAILSGFDVPSRCFTRVD